MRGAVSCYLKAGIISGKCHNTLASKVAINRAEVAVIVKKLLQKSGLV